MNLSREVLPVEVVLAGSVEVELSKAVRLAANSGSTIGHNLDSSAQVLKLGATGVRADRQAKGRAADGGLPSVDVDGGLTGANGTELIVSVEAVPVEGPVQLMVPEGTVSPLDKVSRARVEGRAVVADGSNQGGEGGENSDGLHCEDGVSACVRRECIERRTGLRKKVKGMLKECRLKCLMIKWKGIMGGEASF